MNIKMFSKKKCLTKGRAGNIKTQKMRRNNENCQSENKKKNK